MSLQLRGPSTASFVRVTERPLSILSDARVDPTGVTGSSAGIQAVLDSAVARAVVIPAGVALKLDAQIKINSNQTLYGEQGAPVPDVGGTVLNWVGPDAVDAIVMKNAPLQSSRIHLEGFRLNDARTAPTSGSGINIQFTYNNVILRKLVVGNFATDAIVVGAPSGGSSDCLILDDLWVTGKQYGVNLSRIDNIASVRDIKGDSYAAQGGSMDALVSIDSVSGSGAAFFLQSLKMETDTGSHLLRLGGSFFGQLVAAGLEMRGHTAAAGGDMVRIENTSTEAAIVLMGLGTNDGDGNAVATTMVRDTAASRTWGLGGKRMTRWERSAGKSVMLYNGIATSEATSSSFTGKVYMKGGAPFVHAAHPDFGGIDITGVADSAVAVQAAIDYAQTLVALSTTTPTVVLPPGIVGLASPITWKSAILQGAGMNVGTRVKWLGAAGATVLTKTADTGGASFGGATGITFVSGTNEPATWLDTTAVVVDKGFRLREVQFTNCTSDAIKVGGWANLHWEHLRFDACGGYAIRATVPNASQNLSSFVLDQFTYDHQRATGNGPGVLLVDNTVNASNLGTLALKNARLEVNTAWSGHQSVVDYKVQSAARALGIHLENLSVAGHATGGYLVYQDTAATNLFPSVTLVNVRQSNLTATVGGSLSSSYPLIPLTPNYGLVSVSQGSAGDLVSSNLRLLCTSFGTETPYTIRRGTEAADRFQQDLNGKLNWGGGSVATDTTLYRSGAALLKTDGGFTVGGALDHDGTTVGFYNTTPAARPAAYTQTYSTASRTHAAYTPDAESVTYVGAADGEAKLADLNALRVAYENLRVAYESTSKVLNQVLDDLQTLGLLQ